MKGIAKAIKRTPHMMTSKVGMSKKSADPEFDDYQRRFAAMEDLVEKLMKDCKKFNESIISLFTSAQNFAEHFAEIFHPIVGEYDVLGKYPTAQDTVQNVDSFTAAWGELRTSVSPEIELIESRIVTPIKELQGVMKQIRKGITKRDHKLVDYDRFNNSLVKLRDKKEKSLSDEKNLFKLEQDFEVATNEYDYINTAMKNDLPRFMQLAVQFIDPLYHSFYYMQLNIFYMLLEKMQSFSSGKYDISVAPAQMQYEYEEKRTDAWQVIEGMSITKRIVSTSKMLQTQRQNSAGSGSSLGTMGSSSRSMAPMRSPSTSSSFVKKAPPPPPASFGSAPPPYSSSATPALSAAASKRAPPPIPMKPKPRVEPPKEYVIALYDFEPQADGDLGFSKDDRIEVVKRTDSSEDWWTGRLNGNEGVFPGNYVQDA